MKDGLYLVRSKGITAGFVVRDGKVTSCAPILRRRLLDHWLKRARWLGP